MPWLADLFKGESVASSVIILSLVAAGGLALGSIRLKGIALGVAGVLFSGLVFGHFHIGINEHVLEFAREFGLILFVYTVGMQVGPSFASSLRREGLPLNIMAASIVGLGVLTMVCISWYMKIPIPVAVGTMSGAVTNTPSLAAAQAALKDIPLPADGTDWSAVTGVGYAVAYPFGVMGIILAMFILRTIFRVNVQDEVKALESARATKVDPLELTNLIVENPNLEGVRVGDISLFEEAGAIISRVQHKDVQTVAHPDTVLHLGDIVLAVGPKPKLHALRLLVGQKASVDLSRVASTISSRKMLITQKAVLGKTIQELKFRERFQVTITRLRRAEVEMPVEPDLRLQYGDTVVVVGEETNHQRVSEILGNSPKALDHPEVIPVFVGIALGVLLGSLPIAVPGLPAPVRLGLAGGPLLVAIILSRVGRIGRLVWFMPGSANFMLRELGIVLFLACVGLKSGDKFVESLVSGQGFVLMGMGAAITLLPLLVVGLVGRFFLKTNYLTLCGLLAGSMTDPPALAFSTSFNKSDAPTVSYAAVYPLTMILRVLAAQTLILLLAG
ncbi:MAG: putative transporter [Candidatus Hydrogenedentes bacterium]|nr:putative transporter [Candidatus Hydrogenedentota bacterium]